MNQPIPRHQCAEPPERDSHRVSLTTIMRSALVAAIVVAGLGLAAAPASAATPTLTAKASIRDCAKTSLTGCKARLTLSSGTAVSIKCWVDASWATGKYRSNRWFFITSAGKAGYVHSSYVRNQAKVGNCSGQRGIRASTWAAEHVGVATMTSTEAKTIGYPNQKYWSGYCAGFASSAYKLGAGYTPRYADHARNRYYLYRNAGLIRTGTPEIGAQVFWPNASSYGHVAIYVGNGMVASTMTGGKAANARVSLTSFGKPAGWVSPSKV